MSDEPNMIKYFVFLALLTCSSFFIADAFSVEIELLKESDSIIDTRGWLKLDEKLTFQEQIQIIITNHFLKLLKKERCLNHILMAQNDC